MARITARAHVGGLGQLLKITGPRRLRALEKGSRLSSFPAPQRASSRPTTPRLSRSDAWHAVTETRECGLDGGMTLIRDPIPHEPRRAL
jgi:hypothetical protein